MKTLKLKQLCYLLGYSKEQAFVAINKLKGGKLEMEDENYKLIDHEFSIDKFYEVHGVDLGLVVKDVENNFCKSKACVDVIFQSIQIKLKPNKMGRWPKSVSIPKQLEMLLSDAQAVKLKDMIRSQFADVLKKTKFREEIIVK